MPASTRVLTLRELNRATLARQLLLERSKAAPLDAIQSLGGLQAQEAQPPFLALWSRLHDFTRAQLVQLLLDRKVVRATAMRATLHLLSASDFLPARRALEPALATGLSVLGKRAEGLDVPALVAEGRDFFSRGPAPFDSFRDHLAARYSGADIRAMAYAVRLHLPLVQVPEPDQPWCFPAAPRFTLAESWIPRAAPTVADPSADLLLAYLAAFGPASAADAQTWSGLKDAKAVLERLRPQLVTFRDEAKRELFDLHAAPRPAPDVPAPVRFLPDFDSLLLAHKDRRRIIADEHRAGLVTKNLRVRATFLVDGFAAGFWTIDRKGPKPKLVLEPFGPLSKQTRAALEAESAALLQFA